MSSVIAEVGSSIELTTDSFTIESAKTDGKTQCANDGCESTAEKHTVELPAVGEGMVVPYASIGLCSWECIHEFAENGPYTDVLTPDHNKEIDKPRRGYYQIETTLYIETIKKKRGSIIDFEIGATKEQALSKGQNRFIDLIDKQNHDIETLERNLFKIGPIEQ